jgi:hypothetical protein
VARLVAEFDWVPYARKHGESRFTRFFQECYLPEKFGYDKRKAHLSSQIVAGRISREEALAILNKPLYAPEERELDIEFVIKKLGFSRDEWNQIMRSPHKTYRNYPHNGWMFDHSTMLTQFVRRLGKGELSRSRMRFEREKRHTIEA